MNTHSSNGESSPFEAPRIPTITVLISGSGSNLQALIDAIETDAINAKIELVISNRPDAYGLTRAERSGIATKVIDHTQYESREAFDRELIKALKTNESDLIVLAGFMRILTPDLVKCFEGKMLNIHPSLLPKYPGLHTHKRAIEAGDKVHGTTIHFVTAELDGGPNIIQASVPVLPNDTPENLAQRVLEKEHIIYPIAVKWYVDGRLKMQEGKVLLDGHLLPEQGVMLNNEHTLH